MLRFRGFVLASEDEVKCPGVPIDTSKDSLVLCNRWLNEARDELQTAKRTITALEKYPTMDPFEAYWNLRKPTADVKYTGRIRVTDKKPYSVDVRTFIQPWDYEILNDLKANNLMVKDPDDCDEAILAIYKHHQQKWLRYQTDQVSVGFPEYWAYPSEMRDLLTSGAGEDCEDYANSLHSYYLAAGVPYWRIRTCAGMTFNGIGHATVYVLADDLKTWKHTNSTTPNSMIPTTFDGLPTSGDSKDGIGLKDYWFSFNQKFAFSTFETQYAQDSFNELAKHIAITPSGGRG